jgi:hypothetical protein
MSPEMIALVRSLVESAQREGQILDAYAAAEQIKQKFPEEDSSVGEMVALMLTAGLPAVEFSPPGLMIEIVLPDESEFGDGEIEKRALRVNTTH